MWSARNICTGFVSRFLRCFQRGWLKIPSRQICARPAECSLRCGGRYRDRFELCETLCFTNVPGVVVSFEMMKEACSLADCLPRGCALEGFSDMVSSMIYSLLLKRRPRKKAIPSSASKTNVMFGTRSLGLAAPQCTIWGLEQVERGFEAFSGIMVLRNPTEQYWHYSGV